MIELLILALILAAFAIWMITIIVRGLSALLEAGWKATRRKQEPDQ